MLIIFKQLNETFQFSGNENEKLLYIVNPYFSSLLSMKFNNASNRGTEKTNRVFKEIDLTFPVKWSTSAKDRYNNFLL